MLGLFKRKKQPDRSIDALDELKDLLFPVLQLMRDRDGRWFHLDCSIDSNLESVLSDLQTGFNDQAAQRTLQSMIERIIKARIILDASSEIDDRAEYFVVDDGIEPDPSIEDRIVASDAVDTL